MAADVKDGRDVGSRGGVEDLDGNDHKPLSLGDHRRWSGYGPGGEFAFVLLPSNRGCPSLRPPPPLPLGGSLFADAWW